MSATQAAFEWSRYAPAGRISYELSSQGDKRFSALYARLEDGRTIEEAYQLDVKGYRASPNDRDWRKGKGKPPLNGKTPDQLWDEYLKLWKQWAAENPALVRELASLARGKVLTDKFASTPVSQARAWAMILNQLQDSKAMTSIRITVGNLKHTQQGIKVDRSSVLGNPFKMSHEGERDAVCDAHEEYFAQVLTGGEPVEVATRIARERSLTITSAWLRPTRIQFMAELDRVEGELRKNPNQPILCWCADARCHADPYARYFKRSLNQSLIDQAGKGKALSQSSPDRITSLEPHQVFVFGANTLGWHGKGSVALAAQRFGAQYGNPRGRQGQSYAIVTKDLSKGLRSIPLSGIEAEIMTFLEYAALHPDNEFLVTKIGCALAGYSEVEIGSLWVGKEIPPNVRLPQAFIDLIERAESSSPHDNPSPTTQPTLTPSAPSDLTVDQHKLDILEAKMNTIITIGTVCPKNQGAGGWCAVIANEHQSLTLRGNAQRTTANKLELTALVTGLEHVEQGSSVQVNSQSEYVVKGATDKSKRKANQGLWQKFDEAAAGLTIEFSAEAIIPADVQVAAQSLYDQAQADQIIEQEVYTRPASQETVEPMTHPTIAQSIQLIAQIDQATQDALIARLATVLEHMRSDPSNYAQGRLGVWNGLEWSLNGKDFVPSGFYDAKLDEFCDRIFPGYDMCLITYSGDTQPTGIGLHRDDAYAQFEARTLTLETVAGAQTSWSMVQEYPAMRWVKEQTQWADQVDFALPSGSVIHFNSKNPHSAEPGIGRWSLNLWKVAEKQKGKHNAALAEHGRSGGTDYHQPEGVEIILPPAITTTKDATHPPITAIHLHPAKVMQAQIQESLKSSPLVIISGGQTGGDMAGLLAAQTLDVPTGGLAPAGWLVEADARYPDRTNPKLADYGLIEAPAGRSEGHTYIIRTECNVMLGDGTIVFGNADPDVDKGSARTLELCTQHGKPAIHCDLDDVFKTPKATATAITEWMRAEGIRVLNVAGNRGSKAPGLEQAAEKILVEAIAPILEAERQSSLPTHNVVMLIDEQFQPTQVEDVQARLTQLLGRVMEKGAESGCGSVKLHCPHLTSESRGWLAESIKAVATQRKVDNLPPVAVTVSHTNHSGAMLIAVSNGRDAGVNAKIAQAVSRGQKIVSYSPDRGKFAKWEAPSQGVRKPAARELAVR